MLDLVLVADQYPGDRRVGLGRADQLEQHDLLLQRLQDRPDRALEVQDATPCQVGGPGQCDALVGALDQRLQQHGGQRRHRLAQRRLALVEQGVYQRRRVGQAYPAELLVDRGAHPQHLRLGQRAGQFDQALLDPAGVGDHHERQPGGGDRYQLQVPYRRPAQARVLHHGHLAGELGEQPDGAVHDVVEVDRPDQEPLDRPALRLGQRLDPGQLVDEQPVPAVGGYPARARVRLPDVALLLKYRHVIAYRGG